MPDASATPLVDTKVGFCFFDNRRALEDRGPPEPFFEDEGCGHLEDRSFEMGLSPGWGDVYIFSLPGQSIDITQTCLMDATVYGQRPTKTAGSER